MPASMISEETGSPIWKVIGNSMAMVAVAPIPGSTPISVPRSTPMRQKPRFASVVAVEKPSARLSRSSIFISSQWQPRAETPERQAERVAEDEECKQRQAGRQHDRGERPHAAAGKGCNQR